MAEKTRVYSGADVDMLTACLTLVKQAIEVKSFLVSKRANWADPFLPDLQKRIEDAFNHFLGVDSAQALREATRIVKSIHQKAMEDLTDLKLQIMEDFKEDKAHRKEILTQLGFQSGWKQAQRGSQQALIEILLTFNKGMTPEMEAKIAKAGTSPNLISSLKEYGQALTTSNVNQEMLKKSRQGISANMVKEFNDIYKATITVSKLSARFFKDDPANKARFSYAQIIKAQSSGNHGKSQPRAGDSPANPNGTSPA
jgi:hypothetical protein